MASLRSTDQSAGDPYSHCGQEGCPNLCVRSGLCLICWNARSDRLRGAEGKVVIRRALQGDPIKPVGLLYVKPGLPVSHYLTMPHWEIDVAETLPKSTMRDREKHLKTTMKKHDRPHYFAPPTRIYHKALRRYPEEHIKNIRAHPDDPVGLWGREVVAWFGPFEEEPVEEKPCADVSGINTPPTPS